MPRASGAVDRSCVHSPRKDTHTRHAADPRHRGRGETPSWPVAIAADRRPPMRRMIRRTPLHRRRWRKVNAAVHTAVRGGVRAAILACHGASLRRAHPRTPHTRVIERKAALHRRVRQGRGRGASVRRGMGCMPSPTHMALEPSMSLSS